jgi:hypothetical protein
MNKPTEESPHYVDEAEWADRHSRSMRGLQYQTEYEAALGRLLVRYNGLEAMVGAVLEGALTKLGVAHLYKLDDYLRGKIDRLELALCALPAWPKPNYERLHRINNRRNAMAHGHFYQDPNTGEYQTRSVHKKSTAKAEVVTREEIHRYIDDVRDAYTEMSGLMPHIWFGDEPAALPEGASLTPTDGYP